MEAPSDKSPPDDGAKPKRRISCLTILLCAAVALLVAYGLYSLWVRSETRKLSARVRQILAEEDARRPGLAEEDNAAPVYVQAFSLYARPKDYWKVYDREKPDPAAIAEHLAKNAACLTVLAQAAERRGCDFGPLEPFGDKRAHLEASIHELTRLSLLAARQQASGPSPTQALPLLSVVLRLIRDADGVHDLIVVYPRGWRSSCERDVCAELRAILGKSDPGAAALENLLGRIGEYLATRPGVSQLFQDCQRSALVLVEDMASGREASLPVFGEMPVVIHDRFRRNLWRASGAPLFEARRLEADMRRAAAAAAKPFPQARAELAVVDKSFNRYPFWAILRNMQGPHYIGPPQVLEVVLIRHTRGLAELHLARLALGCRLHRLKFGAYPEKLSDLREKFPEHFKQLPADPFTDKPFFYARTEKGCRIWSAGPDCRDDGGAAFDDNKETGDLVFELNN